MSDIMRTSTKTHVVRCIHCGRVLAHTKSTYVYSTCEQYNAHCMVLSAVKPFDYVRTVFYGGIEHDRKSASIYR